MIRKVKYIILLCCVPAILDVFGQPSLNFTHELSNIEAISQGLRFQIQADSMLRMVNSLNALLITAPESEKRSIRLAILNYDIQAVKFQKQADDLFQQVIALKEINEKSNIPDAESPLEDTQMKDKPKFDILSKSPYSANNPIPIDEPLPDRVAYKIQLGAFSKTLPANAFRGLSPISGEKMENGATKYYVGLFWQYNDADEALRKVRDYGFKDAFIVSFYNRKPISSERARQLE